MLTSKPTVITEQIVDPQFVPPHVLFSTKIQSRKKWNKRWMEERFQATLKAPKIVIDMLSYCCHQPHCANIATSLLGLSSYSQCPPNSSLWENLGVTMVKLTWVQIQCLFNWNSHHCFLPLLLFFMIALTISSMMKLLCTINCHEQVMASLK